MSPASHTHAAQHTHAAPVGVPDQVHLVEPAPRVSGTETARSKAARKATARGDRRPTGLFEFQAQRSHKPTLPSRRLADRARVTRRRQRGIPVTWIDHDRAADGVLIHLHGGGYVLGESANTWDWLEDMGRRAEVAVAMVHYRMAPRDPFPAAYDDAREAVRGILEEGAQYESDWVLSGDSAGGGLALSVAQDLVAHGDRLPSSMLLTSPWVDLTGKDLLRGRQEDTDPLLSGRFLDRASKLHAGAWDRADPRISPLFGEMSGLPPVHLTVGGDELLLGDALRLRDGLALSGVPVDYLEQPGAWHDYPVTWHGPTSQYARRSQIAAVRGVLGRD
jgi:monoterpene epsilon-lactone hydrolase